MRVTTLTDIKKEFIVMIELNKSEVEVITSYLDLLEKVLAKGGARCRGLLKEVRSNNQELKDKIREV